MSDVIKWFRITTVFCDRLWHYCFTRCDYSQLNVN